MSITRNRFAWVAGTLFLALLCACGNEESHTPYRTMSTAPSNYDAKHTALSQNQEVDTISVPVFEHSKKIPLSATRLRQSELSRTDKVALREWWDSLPHPVQAEIQEKRLSIEVSNTFRTKDESKIDDAIADTRIEATGRELERIIGKPAEMTYTVSKTIMDGPAAADAAEEYATQINLYRKVPVHLASYNLEIFLRDDEVTREDLYSAQHWWMQLPYDLQDKIKRHEILLDVTCYSIDRESLDGQQQESIGSMNEEYAAAIAEQLHQNIGRYRHKGKIINLATIRTRALIEKSSETNASYPANRYVRISLRRNDSGRAQPQL